MITGIVFSEETFGKPLPLTTRPCSRWSPVASSSGLLIGRAALGLARPHRDPLTLGGFVLLLLSYVGSRFVLEVVLRRHLMGKIAIWILVAVAVMLVLRMIGGHKRRADRAKAGPERTGRHEAGPARPGSR